MKKNERQKSIEEYIIEREINTTIAVCVDFGKTLEETLQYVLGKFKSSDEDYIIKQFNELKKLYK